MSSTWLLVVMAITLAVVGGVARGNDKTIFSTHSLLHHQAFSKEGFHLFDEGDVPVTSSWITFVNYQTVSNSQNHHTDSYNKYLLQGDTKLVLRRGALVDMDVTLSQQIDEQTVSFYFGDNQLQPASSLSGSSSDTNTWMTKVGSVKTTNSSSKTVQFQLQIPGNAAIGKYKVSISSTSRQYLCDVFVFFNPWSAADKDMYYTEDTKDLDEYVLADVGRIWRGDVEYFTSSPWAYRQFEVADTVLSIFDKADVSVDLSSPVFVFVFVFLFCFCFFYFVVVLFFFLFFFCIAYRLLLYCILTHYTCALTLTLTLTRMYVYIKTNSVQLWRKKKKKRNKEKEKRKTFNTLCLFAVFFGLW